MKNKFLLTFLAVFLPLFTYAQSVDSLITKVNKWVGSLVPILVGVALVFFIWQLIILIRSSEESKREEAKKGMWWGIFAMFVIISIWGIVRFISNTLLGNSNVDQTIEYPKPPGSGA